MTEFIFPLVVWAKLDRIIQLLAASKITNVGKRET
jgi:hypothetical protein